MSGKYSFEFNFPQVKLLTYHFCTNPTMATPYIYIADCVGFILRFHTNYQRRLIGLKRYVRVCKAQIDTGQVSIESFNCGPYEFGDEKVNKFIKPKSISE